MIYSTLIFRLDGLVLTESVDTHDPAKSGQLDLVKKNVKQVVRRINHNSEPQASIESGKFTIHYIVRESLVLVCICDRSYPRKHAFTLLSDIHNEFTNLYPASQYTSPNCRPYSFLSFDSVMQRAKKTYQDTRALQSLNQLNSELKDVTNVMTKNIEDLLYRGDSLERMGDMSFRLREDSKKYRKAAVRINWNLLVKQYAPIIGFSFVLAFLLWKLVL